MIIVEKWREPPVLEHPEPKFGVVVKSLNELLFYIQENEGKLNTEIATKISEIRVKLNTFQTEVPALLKTHTDKRGAVHRETKNSIGLDKVDNIRKATLDEMTNLVAGDLLVTPKGVTAAIAKNNTFRKGDYQQNDLFSFGSIHNSDYYERTPNNWRDITYYESGHCPLGFQNDRVLVSPAKPAAATGGHSGYLSDSVQAASLMLLNERQDQVAAYLGTGWGMHGMQTTDNKVALFRPLVNLGKFDYPSQLNTPGTKGYLLWDSHVVSLAQGMAFSATATGNTITLYHDVFLAGNPTVDPTLQSMTLAVPNATLTRIGNTASIPVKGSHTYALTDFFTLPAGGTVAINPAAKIPISISMCWAAQDREIYLHVAVPVVITVGSIKVEYILRFTESWVVIGVLTNQAITITQLGNLVKDSVAANGNVSGTANWLMPCDWSDPLNPIALPGLFLKSGMVVNALTTKYGVKLKYSDTALKTTLDYVNQYKTTPKPTTGVTRTFAPGRYVSFGEIPERIIPVEHTPTSARYLSYQVINKKHGYGWVEHSWYNTDVAIVNNINENDYSFRSPDSSVVYEFDNGFADSLIATSGASGGASISGLAFTPSNKYIGRAGFRYLPGSVTLGTEVKLNQSTMSAMAFHANLVLARAKAKYYPAIDYTGKVQAVNQVFCIDAAKALVVISDGLMYAEAVVLPYTTVAGIVTVNLPVVATGILTEITRKPAVLPTGSRTSLSKDGVNHLYSDLQVYIANQDSYHCTLNRAYGDVFGDISFTIYTYRTNPTLSPLVNNPARLYQRKLPIDVVDELYPPILVPGGGLYTETPALQSQLNTKMQRLVTGSIADPYFPADNYYCIVPSGTRCILGGRSFTLDRSYYLAHNNVEETCFYLTRKGNVVILESFHGMQEPSNSMVLYAVWRNGGLQIQQSFIVLDDHLMSYTRRGSAVPLTNDIGDARGSNIFFRNRDAIAGVTSRMMSVGGWLPELKAGSVQFLQYDTAGVQRAPTDNFDIGWIDIKFNVAATLTDPHLKISSEEAATNNGDYFSYSLTQAGTYSDSVVIDRPTIANGETIRIYVKVTHNWQATKRVKGRISMTAMGDWDPASWSSEQYGYQVTHAMDQVAVTFNNYTAVGSGPSWDVSLTSPVNLDAKVELYIQDGTAGGYRWNASSGTGLIVDRTLTPAGSRETFTALRLLEQDYADNLTLTVYVTWGGVRKAFTKTNCAFTFAADPLASLMANLTGFSRRVEEGSIGGYDTFGGPYWTWDFVSSRELLGAQVTLNFNSANYLTLLKQLATGGNNFFKEAASKTYTLNIFNGNTSQALQTYDNCLTQQVQNGQQSYSEIVYGYGNDYDITLTATVLWNGRTKTIPIGTRRYTVSQDNSYQP